MSAYLEMQRRYNVASSKAYREIMEIAENSPYPHSGNGKQYCDFIVGTEKSKVSKVRVLVDFRGEYFSSFFLGTDLPVSVTGPIRNIIHFTAEEAYSYIINKANQLNSMN